MADFKTHISVAATGSSLLATLYLGAGVIQPNEVVILWTAGTLGGILPDIDSDNSTALRLIFTFLAVLLSFLVVFSQIADFSILELWLLWGGTYLLIRYGIMLIFKQFTVHRGILHSILAALLFWFATTAFCFHLLNCEPLLAWLAGSFLFAGCLLHLGLDELYSVDFMNRRIKRSAGSAFKLYDYQDVPKSLLVAAMLLLMFSLTPDSQAFIQLFTTEQMYARIWANLLPV